MRSQRGNVLPAIDCGWYGRVQRHRTGDRATKCYISAIDPVCSMAEQQGSVLQLVESEHFLVPDSQSKSG
jgi:hypothetical protein